MKKHLLLLSLLSFLLVPQGVSAKLNTPQNPTLPSVGERSAIVHWDWTPGGGIITDFELLFGRKEGTAICENIKEWEFSFHPGKDKRDSLVRGLSKLEQGQVYCWKIMARAVDPINNSEFKYGPEFRNAVVDRNDICGNGTCGTGEDIQSCPQDCSASTGNGGVPAILKNPISSQTLPQLLESVLNFLFGVSLVVLPIIILYGGFLLLTAGGNPEKISKARTILLWAVIAFAVILLARGLPMVLRNLL